MTEEEIQELATQSISEYQDQINKLHASVVEVLRLLQHYQIRSPNSIEAHSSRQVFTWRTTEFDNGPTRADLTISDDKISADIVSRSSNLEIRINLDREKIDKLMQTFKSALELVFPPKPVSNPIKELEEVPTPSGLML